ncbi:MAG TPA: hypothetical protein VGM30_16105 [Puia sp.]|jgi:hypothetical protein
MKSFLLTVISFFLIFLVLNTGYYKEWFHAKPLLYWSDFQKEKEDTADAVGIMKVRYGIIYTICLKIRQVVEQKKVARPVILFEPNSYYRDSLHMPLHVPEPAVFYYYTGLEGVWTNSPNVSQANFILRISKKGANLDAIRSPQELQRILASYKKFTPIL